ncbi:CBS domain-containing protein [Sabulicella glaciei]|uniref:CBS domain-containing protein n=1 Tax=Sabulicella glaciei TaxID=2984948 RepID=A0ABT3NWT7_9PROT|nr:CBS domain-containing protein [Roseococcus sp. MDT2-1-1]MCW8086640.1 CBS domain-containing protein [Roseococcus sp. MDT2-1-1]
MRAADLMTASLLTVTPDTPIAEVANLLASRGVSAVPVLEADGRLAGIVTEADLVRRVAGEAAGRRPGWFSTVVTGRVGTEADHYARMHGARASDVMTTEVVTVEEDTPAADIARLMEDRKVKRVPVLRDGQLVGIVSRADLLGLAFAPPSATAGPVPDERIRRAVEAALREQNWADASLVYPAVSSGVVTFHGFCRSPSVPKALRVLAERVPGVKGVEMDLAPPPPFVLGVP